MFARFHSQGCICLRYGKVGDLPLSPTSAQLNQLRLCVLFRSKWMGNCKRTSETHTKTTQMLKIICSPVLARIFGGFSSQPLLQRPCFSLYAVSAPLPRVSSAFSSSSSFSARSMFAMTMATTALNGAEKN